MKKTKPTPKAPQNQGTRNQKLAAKKRRRNKLKNYPKTKKLNKQI